MMWREGGGDLNIFEPDYESTSFCGGRDFQQLQSEFMWHGVNYDGEFKPFYSWKFTISLWSNTLSTAEIFLRQHFAKYFYQSLKIKCKFCVVQTWKMTGLTLSPSPWMFSQIRSKHLMIQTIFHNQDASSVSSARFCSLSSSFLGAVTLIFSWWFDALCCYPPHHCRR